MIDWETNYYRSSLHLAAAHMTEMTIGNPIRYNWEGLAKKAGVILRCINAGGTESENCNVCEAHDEKLWEWL